jgi:hypothetical protein
MDKTYLYVATGINYAEECICSASRLKKIEPETPITIYSENNCLEILESANLFSSIEILPNPLYDFHDKINAINLCQYKKIIYIDSDTTILNRFELWDILDQFELAFVYDPIRWDFDLPEIPEAFTTPNGGFLALNKTASVSKMLQNWLRIFDEQLSRTPKPPHDNDQPALRKAIYESGLRFLVLPEEYNLRVSFAHMVPGNVRIKMLHGRHDKLESALNATQRVEFLPRVYGGIYRKWELFDLLKQNLFKRLKYKSKIKRTSFINKD